MLSIKDAYLFIFVSTLFTSYRRIYATTAYSRCEARREPKGDKTPLQIFKLCPSTQPQSCARHAYIRLNMKYNNYRQKHRKHAPDDAPHSRGRPPDHQQIEQGGLECPLQSPCQCQCQLGPKTPVSCTSARQQNNDGALVQPPPPTTGTGGADSTPSLHPLSWG